MSSTKKNIIIYIIIGIVVVFVLAFFIRNNANQDNEYLKEITENIYEMNSRKIEFLDLPENEPETVVSNYYLIEITGEFEKLNYYFPSMPDTIIDNSLIAYKEGKGYKYIKILEINTLSEQDIANTTIYGKSLKDAKVFFSDKTYKEKAEEQNLQDYEIVQVKVETAYTDESMKGAPQYPDGLMERYFIVAPDDRGNYIIIVENMR